MNIKENISGTIVREIVCKVPSPNGMLSRVDNLPGIKALLTDPTTQELTIGVLAYNRLRHRNIYDIITVGNFVKKYEIDVESKESMSKIIYRGMIPSNDSEEGQINLFTYDFIYPVHQIDTVKLVPNKKGGDEYWRIVSPVSYRLKGKMERLAYDVSVCIYDDIAECLSGAESFRLKFYKKALKV